ncbi:MAG: IS1634 family transposase [Desulfurispora sp.]|uniref:IS1634 family transposase n=1 Tax=Desulfurispora sp. TaxID=3014275 RepID=UPI00404A9979
MFFRKITSKSNGKEYTYVKLIENYREGNKVKQRVIANLGNIEELTPEKVQGLISGLAKICGLPEGLDSALVTQRVLEFGNVLAIHKIWQILQITEHIQKCSGALPHTPLLAEILTIHQLVKKHNMRRITEWYEQLYLPHLENTSISPDQFSRTLTNLATIKEELEKALFQVVQKFCPDHDQIIFCHLTRGYLEQSPSGNGRPGGSGRPFIATPLERRQVDLALLVNQSGLPFGHRMFLGHLADGETVPRRISEIKGQYQIKNCVFVGDQQIITEENLQLLQAYGQEYIVGMPVRFNHEATALTQHFYAPATAFTRLHDNLLYREVVWRGHRYLICLAPLQAAGKAKRLESRLLEVEKELALSGKFLIKTNCHYLSAGQIIAAYQDYTLAREEFRLIKKHEQSTGINSESQLRGYVFVCVLAYLIKKTLEKILSRGGLEISPEHALELLEDIKLTVNICQNEELRYITPPNSLQEDILSLLGIKQLPRRLEKNALL